MRSPPDRSLTAERRGRHRPWLHGCPRPPPPRCRRKRERRRPHRHPHQLRRKQRLDRHCHPRVARWATPRSPAGGWESPTWGRTAAARGATL